MTLGKIFLFFIASALIAFSSEYLLLDTIYYKNPAWYPFVNSYVPALLAIMLASWPLIDLQALLHAAKIKNGVWITHWKANIIRFLVSLAFCSLYHFMTWNVWKVGTLMLFSFCWFGIVFNFKLNRYRGLDPLYVGQDDHKDALIDKIFSKLGENAGIILFIVQALGMALTGWLYVRV